MYLNKGNNAFAVLLGWGVLGALLLALTAGFTLASPLFGYAYEVRVMPVFALAGGLTAAGALVLTLPWLVRAAKDLTPGTAKALLWAMLAAGLAMRLVLFASEPALEDDYQRYLWDGAVTAHGLNPYAQTPDAAKTADPEHMALGRVAIESGRVLDRVNHSHLRTVYPPVAQGAFALSHMLAPWSLAGWRLVILALDTVSIALIFVLLRDLGRSPLWAALYWWNPIALKELFNSAHMETLVVPLVLGALVLAIRHRPLAATASLTLAAGAKIWPVILLPLIWRGMTGRPKKLAAAIIFTGLACALFAWPMIASGLDQTSGLAAYSSAWKTNSALFPVIEGLAGGVFARGLVALAVLGVMVWQCRTPSENAQQLVSKVLVVTTALFLLFPAQFPWYYLWVLPLLSLRPVPGLLILTATLPLYYTAFYFLPRGTYEVYAQGLVWLVWLPAWGLLAWNARHWIAGRPASHERRAA